MHEFFLLKKKKKKKEEEEKTESLTLLMDGVEGNLGWPGMDGVGGGRHLS
jgi:hypothetical protein